MMQVPKRDYAKATKFGPTIRARRIFLAGIEGIGKTTALTQCPNPYIICAEDGLTEDSFAGIANYAPESWEDLFGVIQWLTDTDHDFKTLGLDTEDWIELLGASYICRRDGKQNLEDYGYGKGQSTILPNEIKLLLSKLEILQQKKDMLIVFTSHITVKTFNNPAGDNYDRFEAAGIRQVVALVKQWCDVNLFATYDVATKKESKKGKAKGISDGSRVVYTTFSAAWDAKNRCSLPAEMPFDMPTILEAIKRGTPDTPENIYADAKALAEKYLVEDNAQTKSKTLAYLERNKTNVANLLVALNKLKHIEVQSELESKPETEPATQAA